MKVQHEFISLCGLCWRMHLWVWLLHHLSLSQIHFFILSTLSLKKMSFQ